MSVDKTVGTQDHGGVGSDAGPVAGPFWTQILKLGGVGAVTAFLAVAILSGFRPYGVLVALGAGLGVAGTTLFREKTPEWIKTSLVGSCESFLGIRPDPGSR